MRFPRIRSERGFSTIELVVGMALALVVLTVPLGLVVNAFRSGERVEATADTTSSIQHGLDKLVRELRVATSAQVTATGVTLSIPIRQTTGRGAPAATRLVTWSCTAGSCRRQAQGGPTVTVIPYVDSASFAPVGTNPGYVDVQVRAWVATGGGRGRILPGQTSPVSIADGADLRNVR